MFGRFNPLRQLCSWHFYRKEITKGRSMKHFPNLPLLPSTPFFGKKLFCFQPISVEINNRKINEPFFANCCPEPSHRSFKMCHGFSHLVSFPRRRRRRKTSGRSNRRKGKRRKTNKTRKRRRRWRKRRRRGRKR